MNAVDIIARIGEVLSWFGLGLGIPLLLGAAVRHGIDGSWIPIEIAVVESGGVRLARWFAGGDFREHRLTSLETGLGGGWHRGFVSSRRSGRIRFVDAPNGTSAAATIGRLLTAVGVVGFLVSWLPALL